MQSSSKEIWEILGPPHKARFRSLLEAFFDSLMIPKEEYAPMCAKLVKKLVVFRSLNGDTTVVKFHPSALPLIMYGLGTVSRESYEEDRILTLVEGSGHARRHLDDTSNPEVGLKYAMYKFINKISKYTRVQIARVHRSVNKNKSFLFDIERIYFCEGEKTPE